MKIELKKYDEQITAWPKSGCHIMAQYGDQELNKKLKISGNNE